MTTSSSIEGKVGDQDELILQLVSHIQRLSRQLGAEIARANALQERLTLLEARVCECPFVK